MRTMIVDDEAWSIIQLSHELSGFKQIELTGSFEDSRKALDFARENAVDFAVLDIEMPYMDGIELGERIRELYPDIILIYLTAYEQYIKEAILTLEADYYLMKPYHRRDIEKMVQRAQALSSRLKKQVELKAFGIFELSIRGEQIYLKNKKARELLALCVHMEGRHVSMERAVDILWEDRPYDERVKSLYRKAVIYLNAVFRDHGITDVFENGRGYCCIRSENVTCDYFEYLAGRAGKGPEYDKNLYLMEYTWAEGTFSEV